MSDVTTSPLVTPSSNSIAQLRQQQLLTDYRLTPATLMARLEPTYIASKWVLYLSMKIAQCIARGSCGLLISAPPRHGKSMLATIATPLWVLENFPNRYCGVVTYGEDLSTDFSRSIRDYVQNNQNILNVRLRSDVTRVANFLTTEGGGLKAVGLRGTITGRGFHVLVIDDYIKEPKEATSASYLEGLYTWYQTVARTRLEPGAVIIIVATRWVKNDLHGKLMKLQQLTGRNFFEVVSLPALAYSPEEVERLPPDKRAQLLGYPDPLGRAPHEALFPERYSQQDMENMRAEMESRWWDAMFQQNPQGDTGSVVDGTMFDIIGDAQYQDILRDYYQFPHNYVVGRYWDMAASQDQGDYSTGARGLLHIPQQFFLTDHIVRGQWSPARAERVFKVTCEQDMRQFPDIKFGMEEEPGSAGKYSVRHFAQILQGIEASRQLIPENAAKKGSKLLAAGPYIGHIEKGKVGLLDAHWKQDYIAEIETFPEGMKDDQVDATSGCYRLVKGLIGQSAVWGRGSEIDRIKSEIHGQKVIPGHLSPQVGVVWGKRAPSPTPGPRDPSETAESLGLPQGLELPPGMQLIEN
jgi:predicted phage terminase large subunit-like protein